MLRMSTIIIAVAIGVVAGVFVVIQLFPSVSITPTQILPAISGAVGGVIISLTSMLISSRTKITAYYQDIDQRYNELLKLGLCHPEFVNKEKTKTYGTEKEDFQDDLKRKYELFAYIWWNICETIHDRKAEKLFWNTWQTALLTAKELHGQYLKNSSPEKLGRFKMTFRKYIFDGSLEREVKYDPIVPSSESKLEDSPSVRSSESKVWNLQLFAIKITLIISQSK